MHTRGEFQAHAIRSVAERIVTGMSALNKSTRKHMCVHLLDMRTFHFAVLGPLMSVSELVWDVQLPEVSDCHVGESLYPCLHDRLGVDGDDIWAQLLGSGELS